MQPIPHPAFCALSLAGALLPFTAGSFAQSTTPPPSSNRVAALAQPTAVTARSVAPAAETPASAWFISERAAAAVAAGLPKYISPTAAPKNPARDEEFDEQDADQPRNQIIRLPVYVVHGPRPPIFRERDVLTQHGLGALAQKRYITRLDRILNGHPIPFFGASLEARALEMYAEDERLHNMADLAGVARNASLLDPAAGADLKRLADQAYMRRSDFGVELSP